MVCYGQDHSIPGTRKWRNMKCINCKVEEKPDGAITHKVGCPEYLRPNHVTYPIKKKVSDAEGSNR